LLLRLLLCLLLLLLLVLALCVVVVVVVVLVVYFFHSSTRGQSATRWAFEATAGNQSTAMGRLRGGCKPPGAGEEADAPHR
jgi:uncharacterized membrane protein